MAQYVEKPATIDAMQFVGGASSASEINNWLSSYGGLATLDSVNDQLIVRQPNPDGSTDIFVCDPTDWVTLDRYVQVGHMIDTEFRFTYTVYDAPPPPEETPA